ncbi:S8 family serine peptidase [Anaeromicropila populeti]|uniref:Serine protease, subtilisin family n=1 Tax=Anaeromicropila populeti TaxID=37658 RepID=A0A1I6I6H6_9FIRM|nr:S8 family serine peptidase [Anaeromicropila populeti]SFR62264.1 Serine protease, subtilisin family [Anaeromicropila populeti]
MKCFAGKKRIKRKLASLFITGFLAVNIIEPFSYVQASAQESIWVDSGVLAESNWNQYVGNDFLVAFDESAGEVAVADIISQLDLVENEFLYDECYYLKASNQTKMVSSINTLLQSGLAASIQPNYQYGTTDEVENETQDDIQDETEDEIMDTAYTILPEQWGLLNTGENAYLDRYIGEYIPSIAGVDINVIPFWNAVKEKESKEVIVAVIDSGVDINHTGLQSKLWINSDEVAGDGIDNDKNGYIDDYYGYNTAASTSDVADSNGHGTHVSGIIAANGSSGVWGVAGASNIKLMQVKVFADSKSGEETYASSFAILRGIMYAEQNGAKVCNLSLGMTTYDGLLANYIKSSSMLFVCAAGNSGVDIASKPIYPAYLEYDNIISVANLRCDGTLNGSSNYGISGVDIAAPGTRIYSTIPNNTYDYKVGTSMAAPFVTGVAALLYSYEDGLSNTAVRKKILSGAVKIDALSGLVETGGRLDVYNAYLVDASAPSITTKTTVYKSKAKASIKVTAADIGTAGVKAVLWKKGAKAAADFKKGTSGTVIAETSSVAITASGTYTIYAVDTNGNETIKKVKVTIPTPTKVKLSKTKITIKKGKTYQLKPVVAPTGVYVKYTYTSSNKKAATVSSTGKITAKGKGTATLTIKTQNGKKVTCKVTVQ